MENYKVEIIKVKKDVPTRIRVNGHEYILDHPNHYKKGDSNGKAKGNNRTT
jgi:hypothetical protein